MESLKGQLLVATPQLRDPNFFQTVVLMVQHDKHGALGLILNRPTETTLGVAWKQVSQKPCLREDALFVGGPCQGVLTALHMEAEASEIEVLPGLHFATSASHVETLVEQVELPARFFVGYAGWSPGQLEQEMESGSWRTAPASTEHVFGDPEDLWLTVMRDLARQSILSPIDPRLVPDDPSVN